MTPLWRGAYASTNYNLGTLGSQGCGIKNIIVLTHTMETSHIIKLIVNKIKNMSE